MKEKIEAIFAKYPARHSPTFEQLKEIFLALAEATAEVEAERTESD